MSTALSHLKLLINLAQIDGTVAEREKNFIINIGRANGIFPDEIIPMLTQRHQLIVPEGLNDEQKFDYLLSLVQLMKIDGRMYKEEILFCSKIASKLGYEQQVMFELMLHVKPATMDKDEIEIIRNLTLKYLNK